MDTLQTILTIFTQVKPGIAITAQDELLENHILSSMEIMMLISELNDAFDIRIALPDLKPEHFRTAQTISELVEKYLDED